jgi:hypothetical protein
LDVVSLLGDIAARDPAFAKEIESLTVEQRGWLEDELALRQQAERLAKELGEDAGDVYHQLKQLRRPPIERLRLALTHGRHRRKLSE